MKIGCAVALDHPTLSAAQCIELVRAVGGETIELQGNNLLTGREEQVRRGDASFAADLAGRLGLPVNSYHSPYGERWDLSSPDEETRLAAVEWVGRCSAPVAAALGAGIVVFHTGVRMNSADERAARRRQFLRSMAEICDVFGQRGLRAAVETMFPGRLGGDVRELIELVDAIDRPNVGVCLDTGHVHYNHCFDWTSGREVAGPWPGRTPSAAEAARLIGPRLITLHVHDNRGDEDSHRFPGWGTIDWQAFVAALREAGYRGVFMHEASPTADDLLAERTARDAWLVRYREFLAPIRAM